MDKEWLHLSRFSEQYRDGAQKFVERARESCNSEMIVCPCVRCRNLMHHHYDTVYEHLIIKGMDPTYSVWVFHGEQPSDANLFDVEIPESHRMFKDFYAQHDVDPENLNDGRSKEIESLVDDVETPLYPGYMGKYWRTFKSRKYWRTFKSRLRKQIRTQVESSVNKARTIALLRPKNINSEKVWKKFVEDTLSAKFYEKSKFSNLRTNQKLLHTMGRKGYSRMTHEMREKNPGTKGLRTRLWTHVHLRKNETPINEPVVETLKKIEDCGQSISNTSVEDSIRDDAVARVLGPECHGRVRGLGFGIASSKVNGQIQSNRRVRELESQLQTQSEKVGSPRRKG